MAERNLDFDTVIERRNTQSLKYDFAAKRGMPEDVLPLWVADMDFKTSSYVEDAVTERTKHGIFGYSEVGSAYYEKLKSWMKKYHSWEPKQEWLVKTPGVVFALAMAVKAYTQPGDTVLIQRPVYYPFTEVIRDNGREVVSNDLYLGEDNRYHIDYEDFEAKIVKHRIRLALFCNPHNPVGRVWTREELERLGDICVKHGVIVVSDEIHHDIILQGTHTVFASVKPEFEDITITCTSASKTFNLASMLVSNIWIANDLLRKKFKKQLAAAGMSQLSILGLVATEAAYDKGEEWYEAMLTYLRGNAAFVKAYIAEHLPGVRQVEAEGTYLIWLDFRETGLTPDQLDDLIVHKAGLWLDSGKMFGKAGEGFQRINIACPRSILKEALERLTFALEEGEDRRFHLWEA